MPRISEIKGVSANCPIHPMYVMAMQQYTKSVPNPLESLFWSQGKWNNEWTMHSFWIWLFPPKFKWKCTYFCDQNAWIMMHELDSTCQERNVPKTTTSIGLMVQKLCTCEVQICLAMIDPYLLNHTWEIHVFGLYWKWENKIYNFHVGQNFIWSMLGHVILRRKPFHFWQFQITGHLLFLETFHLTSNSSLLMFDMSNETCMDMNEVSLTISHLQNHDWMHSWLVLTFLGFWLTEPCSDEFQAFFNWDLDSKWYHKLYELFMNDHGVQILQG